MDLQNIHIGNIIKEKLNEKSMTITDLAKKINRDRTTVYDIFERKSIDIELLIKISDVLDYDFIHKVYFPENANTPKILIAVEIEKNKMEKMDLPEEFVRFVKLPQKEH